MQLNVNVFLRSVIQVVFTLGFMVYINLKLAIACFVIVPAIVFISKVGGLDRSIHGGAAQAGRGGRRSLRDVASRRLGRWKGREGRGGNYISPTGGAARTPPRAPPMRAEWGWGGDRVETGWRSSGDRMDRSCWSAP